MRGARNVKVIDFDGTLLDASFSVADEGAGWSLVFESSGGRAGGPNPRNLQYRRGLNVLLARLQMNGAVVSEIRVETERTKRLPVDQQRVRMDGRSFPLVLATVTDLDQLRKEISRCARRVGQDVDQRGRPGGSSRRLRIFLDDATLNLELLERLLQGQGADPDAAAVDAVVAAAAGRPSSLGQGFLISYEARVAIERHAVDTAVRYYEAAGWGVSDVGAVESFDLRCERDGQEVHVEVKGTTGHGERIILTPNEVAHARDIGTDLFVVTGIELTYSDDRPPVATGGRAHVLAPWAVHAQCLQPVGFFYSTGLGDAVNTQAWRSAM
jgi:hypothetical protein